MLGESWSNQVKLFLSLQFYASIIMEILEDLHSQFSWREFKRIIQSKYKPGFYF